MPFLPGTPQPSPPLPLLNPSIFSSVHLLLHPSHPLPPPLLLPEVPRWGTCRLLDVPVNNVSCSPGRGSGSVALTCSCASNAWFEDEDGFCLFLTYSSHALSPNVSTSLSHFLSPSTRSSHSLPPFLFHLYLNYSHLASLICTSLSFLDLTYFSWEINAQPSGAAVNVTIRARRSWVCVLDQVGCERGVYVCAGIWSVAMHRWRIISDRNAIRETQLNICQSNWQRASGVGCEQK